VPPRNVPAAPARDGNTCGWRWRKKLGGWVRGQLIALLPFDVQAES